MLCGLLRLSANGLKNASPHNQAASPLLSQIAAVRLFLSGQCNGYGVGTKPVEAVGSFSIIFFAMGIFLQEMLFNNFARWGVKCNAPEPH
jgi:hypothetical protein